MNPDPQETERAYAHLFESHRERVLAFVHCYCHQDNPTIQYLEEDLRSEALLGLWQACTRFKQTEKNTFWTFAYLRVRGSVIDFLRREKITVRGDRLEKQGQVQVVALPDSCNNSTTHIRGFGSNPDTSFPAEFTHVENALNISQSITAAHLTDQEAEVFRQYHIEEQSAEQIAAKQNVCLRVTYTTLRKAEDKIRSVSVHEEVLVAVSPQFIPMRTSPLLSFMDLLYTSVR